MSKALKSYAVEETFAVADNAAAAVSHFLLTTWPQTVAVHNVEADPAFQTHDVDLLWTIVDKSDRLRIIPVEVKGDRYDRTGNFFFETVSNAGKGTPGCFLATRADWFFYYFVRTGRLYCLPMERVRPWFLAQIDRFAERRTQTPVGAERYTTIGRLVPIKTVLTEVEGVLAYQREEAGWLEV